MSFIFAVFFLSANAALAKATAAGPPSSAEIRTDHHREQIWARTTAAQSHMPMIVLFISAALGLVLYKQDPTAAYNNKQQNKSLAQLRSAHSCAGPTSDATAEPTLHRAALFNRLHQGIVIYDAQGRIIDCNDAALAMLDLPRQEVLQKSDEQIPWDFITEEGAPLPPEDYPAAKTIEQEDCNHLVLGRRNDNNNIAWYMIDTTVIDAPANESAHVCVTLADVTECKESELAGKRAEAFFSQGRLDLERAQEVGQIGSWRLDVQNNVLSWSDMNHRIFGIPKGKPLAYEDFLAVVHPDDREEVDQKWKAALRGEPYDIEHRLLTQGKVKWVRERAYLEFDDKGELRGGFGITQDITDRKQAEAALHDAQRFAQNLIEAASIMIIALDLNGQVIEFNPAAEHLTGYHKDELAGKDWFETLVPRDRYPQVWQEFDRLKQGGLPGRFENPILTKDGMERLITWSNSEIHKDDQLTGFICFGLDVTEQREAERNRDKLLQALEIKNEELESIIYVSSHDLRAPMINITGYGQILKEACEELAQLFKDATASRKRIEMIVNQDIPMAVDFIVASSNRLNDLQKGLVRLCRVGRMSLDVQTLDMNHLVNEILRTVQYQLETTGAEVQVDTLPKCLGDTTQITQVFGNLIDNALKYLSPQRPGKIQIIGRTEGCRSVYCVQDNGIGIAESNLRGVFEIFHRLDPNSSQPGEGLGLTVVRRIIDRHNGEVWVESEFGQGSCFFVALPNHPSMLPQSQCQS